ncbi:MAG: hypothetical protein GOP50_06580 [Candidatus Heimdallarchaeota archaeon]|nr:hypothetical protein [Candidatus Heimdallarchaeota archaeon]
MASSPKKFTFPNGLYEYLVRKANAAVSEIFIDISFPILEIKFLNIRRKGSQRTVDWLFEELSKRIVRVTRKYQLDIGQTSHRKDIMIDFIMEKSYQQINITGYHYIPLKSFGNILSIAVWSYIVFSTGNKPSEDEEAQRLHKKYTDTFEDFKDHWNRMPRKKKPIYEEKSCYICGEPAFALNVWVYKTKDKDLEVSTPICKKHKDKLI